MNFIEVDLLTANANKRGLSQVNGWPHPSTEVCHMCLVNAN